VLGLRTGDDVFIQLQTTTRGVHHGQHTHPILE
jgi:hypothetical protein